MSIRGRRIAIVGGLGVLAIAAGAAWRTLSRLRGRPVSPGRPISPKHASLGKLSAPRIVIEKSAHVLSVYDADREVKVYRAAFGPGRGDKVREGDRRTPEGEFYVCCKNPRSRFVLSLGLSYPNVEDAARGLRDGLITRDQHDAIVAAIRSGGQPPWKTPLGGEIMIHGNGSDRDWTLGCVALDDDDIRELYPAVGIGTPVTILP